MKDFDSHNHIFGSDNRCQICDAHAPEPPAFLRRQTTDYECAISMLDAQTVAKSKLLGENLVLKARIADHAALLRAVAEEARKLRHAEGCHSFVYPNTNATTPHAPRFVVGRLDESKCNCPRGKVLAMLEVE